MDAKFLLMLFKMHSFSLYFDEDRNNPYCNLKGCNSERSNPNRIDLIGRFFFAHVQVYLIRDNLLL